MADYSKSPSTLNNIPSAGSTSSVSASIASGTNPSTPANSQNPISITSNNQLAMNPAVSTNQQTSVSQTPLSSTQNTAQQPQQYSAAASSDIKSLQCMQYIFTTLINDCIRLTDWNNTEQVTRHKTLLFQRIKERLNEVSSRINQSHSQQQPQRSSDSETEENTNDTTSNQKQKQSLFQRSSPDSSTQRIHTQQQQKSLSYIPSANTAQPPQPQHQKKNKHGKDNSDSDYQAEESSGDEYGTGISKKTKYIYKKPREYKFAYPNLSASHQQLQLQQQQLQQPQLLQQQQLAAQQQQQQQMHPGQFRMRSALDEPSPKSINNYPISEKLRVLQYFNEHYDPSKRNKIDLVHRIVNQFNYSYSSIYYLVTNQKTLAMTAATNSTHSPVSSQSYPPKPVLKPSYNGISGGQYVPQQLSASTSSASSGSSYAYRAQNQQAQVYPTRQQQQFGYDSQQQRYEKKEYIDPSQKPDDNDLFRDEGEIPYGKSHMNSLVSPMM